MDDKSVGYRNNVHRGFENNKLIEPVWPIPSQVRAAITTSRSFEATITHSENGNGFDGDNGCDNYKTYDHEYGHFNLGDHVGDDPIKVAAHRGTLESYIDKPISWLNQVHGIDVHEIGVHNVTDSLSSHLVKADAQYTQSNHCALAIMTADCLPALFCSQDGSEIGAAHGGWRGLLNGVLEQTLLRFSDPEKVLVYLGPAIGPNNFEVGDEVRNGFMGKFGMLANDLFVETRPGHFNADLYGLAKLTLNRVGCHQIYGGGFCTYDEKDRFYSYRRENKTGRMASLIWRV